VAIDIAVSASSQVAPHAACAENASLTRSSSPAAVSCALTNCSRRRESIAASQLDRSTSRSASPATQSSRLVSSVAVAAGSSSTKRSHPLAARRSSPQSDDR
jgi:hypothetical protein